MHLVAHPRALIQCIPLYQIKLRATLFFALTLPTGMGDEPQLSWSPTIRLCSHRLAQNYEGSCIISILRISPKYIVFTVVPYNAVDDAVMCTIRHESESRGKVTGPVAPGQWYGKNYQWECAWYNNTIVRAELKQIYIQYMDGTTEQLSGQDVKYVQY